MRSDNLCPISPANMELLRAWAAGNALEVVEVPLAIERCELSLDPFHTSMMRVRAEEARFHRPPASQNQDQGKKK